MTGSSRLTPPRSALLLQVLVALSAASCDARDPDALQPAGKERPATTVAISDVQGPGDASPRDGQSVRIQGVVSGDFQDGDSDEHSNLGGFFLQSLSDDGNPVTSEGVFVFEPRGMHVDVAVGDTVAVSGRVQEHFGETQVVAAAVTRLGNADVRVADLSLPAPDAVANSDGDYVANLEAFEGMPVRFAQVLTVNQIYDLERFGELRVSAGGRAYQFTNRASPNAAAYSAHRRAVATRTITLDDGLRASFARPVRYLAHDGYPAAAIRIGDTLSGLQGNLRYSRGSGGDGRETWRLMPTSDPAFAEANPRPGKPRVAGALRIASFNLLNYFSTVDTGRGVCGPSGADGCRGADSAVELERQRQKIVTALSMIDADIAGLVELENNDSQSLADIVGALNASVGEGTYSFVRTGTIGSDAIKTGFVFKPATVALEGDFALLDSTLDPRFDDRRNRPALAQTFRLEAGGTLITVVINHLKSKGSDCVEDGDPNLGDGQGNCNATRTRAAAALADWLAGDPTHGGAQYRLIVGDLNAYPGEDPLAALEAAGFVSLVESANGAEPYSFVYDGQSGALDHAFASPRLARYVVEAFEWHINADEAPIHDYNLDGGRDSGVFDGGTPYRASDHDPIVIGIDFGADLD